MLNENRYWKAVKSGLRLQKHTHLLLLVAVGAVFPLIENVLTSKWYSSANTELAGWMLLLVGVMHAAFLLALFVNENSCSQAVLASAVEEHEELSRTRDELDRRSDVYKLVRSAFDILNARKCELIYGPRDPYAVDEKFRQGITPLLEILKNDIFKTLGVKNRFTIQIWFQNGYRNLNDLSSDPAKPLLRTIELGEQLFGPSSVLPSEIQNLPALCYSSPAGFQRTVMETPQLSDGTGNPREDVTFRRYVFSHIIRPCTPDRAGVLIVTSTQNEPFADDAVDTLAFFAAAVANYTTGFIECIEQNQRYGKPTLVVSIDEVCEEINGTYDLPVPDSSELPVKGPGFDLIPSEIGWVIRRANGVVVLRHSIPQSTSPEGAYVPIAGSRGVAVATFLTPDQALSKPKLVHDSAAVNSDLKDIAHGFTEAPEKGKPLA